MKASVLTLHTVANYGTQLQAYATQEKLKEYFEEVEFINYKRRDTYGKGLINSFSKGNFLKAIAIYPTILYWTKVFGRFQREYLNIAPYSYYQSGDFKNFRADSDVYFSGSDQVWNSGWNKGIIKEMYLSFVPKSKPKFAYASSFGNSKLSDYEIKETHDLIKQYNMISVREETGLEILKLQYHYENAIRLVDPTLAMTADFWRKLGRKSKKKIKGKYILIYNLNRSKEFDEYARKIQKLTKYKLYRFCTRFDQVFRTGRSLIIPEIIDFISLIDNAEFVLTDSFHATAFSMNLNTKPICIYPENYSNRISEFLELVNATQMHAYNYEDLDIIHRSVDFEKVNEILNKERKRVDEYLAKVKNIVEEHKYEKE